MTNLILEALPYWILMGILGWQTGKSLARDEWIQVTFTTGAMILVLWLQIR